MKRYYLGADVGATKTCVLIGDQDGVIVGSGSSGPGNHESVGFGGLQEALSVATGQALAAAGIPVELISGAAFGVAGYDWPFEREAILKAVHPLGIQAPLEVVNDAIIGLIAGSPQGWGVAVVSGTGCNCRGWNKERTKVGRVVGISQLGEGAGATELIEKAVQAIAHEWTQRGPHTALTPLMINYVGAKNLADFLEGYCEGRYPLDSSAAPLVFQAAADGDRVASDLIHWAGCELGELARAVIRQLKFETLDFDVVLVGGMFAGGPMLVDPMRRAIWELAPEARFIRLAVPPAVGALLLGMEISNYTPPAAVQGVLRRIQPAVSDQGEI